MNEKIENLIIKFLLKEANIDELRQLEVWVSNSKNEKLFYDYININTSININEKDYDLKSAKKIVVGRINQGNGIFRTKIKYAAVLALVFLTATYFFKDDVFNTSISNNESSIGNPIIPGSDKAVLTLEDGTNVELDKGKVYKDQNSNSDGEKLVYQNRKEQTARVKYNYLTIPRGGQYYIVLSDGTEVWLNSESQLRYPVSFIEGKTREVELVYGEAYFNVSPSSEHSGSKFKVLNQSQEVNVLGTEFNIKAYKDETNIYTTLVEGKVKVSFDSQEQDLVPSQRLDYDLNTNELLVTTVDVYNEISWKEGVFSFQKMELEKIMKVLGRWYDFQVVFENDELRKIKFNGVLGKEQTIEEILKSIINFKIIEAYEIKEKTIVLK